MRIPHLSVITCCHNDEAVLAQTLESILGQSYGDFEYILVDDGSTDGTAEIIARYAAADSRITTLYNPQPLRPGGALNRGLAAARGDYFANLDSDDLALSGRLRQQVAFLDAHPDIGIVGSWGRVIDLEGKEIGKRVYPTLPNLIRWTLLIYCCMIHSSVMARRHVIQQAGGYSARHWLATDYELLLRLNPQVAMANLPEPLVAVRQSTDQTSAQHGTVQHGEVVMMMAAAYYRLLGRRVPLEVVQLIHLLRPGVQREGMAAIEGDLRGQAEATLEALYAAFCVKLGCSELTPGGEWAALAAAQAKLIQESGIDAEEGMSDAVLCDLAYRRAQLRRQ